MAAVFNDLPSSTQYNVSDIILNITQNVDTSRCPVLSFKGTAPWNRPSNVVSAYAEDFVHRVKYTVLLPLLFLIGGTANIINMVVYYKHGLKERINVCLFALSLVDFLTLFCNFVFYSEQMVLQLLSGFTLREKYSTLMRFIIDNNLMGFIGFGWASQIISTLIASERCFCILWPLRSQTVISTSTTTIIIVLSSVVTVGLYAVKMTSYRTVCIYNPLTDSNDWNLYPSKFFIDNRVFIYYLDLCVFGLGIPSVTISVTIIATVVTIIKLHQAAAWRAGTSSSSTVSAREMALTRMLVYNSIFFIICVSPPALFRLVSELVPSIRSQYNLLLMMNWLLDSVGYINATFNFVIYYAMGSRYRQTFWQLMGRDKMATK